jgi:transcriptional regulator with XRE-family HTH domain
MADIKKSLGLRIRQLRMSKGLTQEQLADLSGISRQYIGDVERGERNIAIVNIEKIARALGVTLRELFDFENE